MLTPNYFGFLNNLVTLINYESFKEIGEIACVTFEPWSFLSIYILLQRIRLEVFRVKRTRENVLTYLLRSNP